MGYRSIAFFAVLQALGYSLDAVWHGPIHPGFEATTRGEMAAHLVPGLLSLVGFAVALAALAFDWRRSRAHHATGRRDHRAA